MAIYALLGDIEFTDENSFTSYRESQDYNYVEDKTLIGRPTLQQVGGEMQKISIEVTFQHSPEVSINPRKEAQKCIDEAERIRETGELASLVYQNRFKGEYVIDSVSETYEKTLPGRYGGEPLIVAVKLELSRPENKPFGSNAATFGGAFEAIFG